MNRFLAAAGCLIVLNVSALHAGTSLFLGKSVDAWKKELNNPDASVRRSAAFALGRMGEDARSAVSHLVRRLQEDKDAGVRDMAACAIGDIARALKDNNATVWQKSGSVLRQLLKDDPSERVRRSAAYALGAFGPQAAEAAEHLMKALGDENPSVRQNAAWALGQLGEKAGESVSKLCECLKDKDTLVRRDAAGALGALGKAAARAGQPLLSLVKSESDAVVKKRGLASLVPIAGPELADSAKDLLALLDDKDPKIRLDAAIVLTRIDAEESANAVRVLRAALKDSEKGNQESATAALAALGPKAKPAMYELADLLIDANISVPVRRNAALALAHMGVEAKPVVPTLAKALESSQPQQVRQFAAEALSRMKYPDNEKGVPALLGAIEKDTDPDVRNKCIEALFQMERPAFKESGAEKLLTKVLDERSKKMELVRYNAARKLAHELLDQAPDKTADVLLEWLTNTSVVIYNRTDARVEGVSTEATAGRTDVRPNYGGDARFLAARALGSLGDKAAKRADVVRALRNAAKDKDANLQKYAKEALANLGLKE